MGRKEGKYKKKARSSKTTGRLKKHEHKLDEICKSFLIILRVVGGWVLVFLIQVIMRQNGA